MPETCWEIVKNKHLTVASCWFSLSLHNLLTMHGHRHLKPSVISFWFVQILWLLARCVFDIKQISIRICGLKQRYIYYVLATCFGPYLYKTSKIKGKAHTKYELPFWDVTGTNHSLYLPILYHHYCYCVLCFIQSWIIKIVLLNKHFGLLNKKFPI